MIGNGSSPWARGTPIVSQWFDLFSRFIPVGTGNTGSPVAVALIVAVHPRGHGEHPLLNKQRHSLNGSSPWARGTRRIIYPKGHNARFIPVGTGNTNYYQNSGEGLAVHPRGHGEHLNIIR